MGSNCPQTPMRRIHPAHAATNERRRRDRKQKDAAEAEAAAASYLPSWLAGSQKAHNAEQQKVLEYPQNRIHTQSTDTQSETQKDKARAPQSTYSAFAHAAHAQQAHKHHTRTTPAHERTTNTQCQDFPTNCGLCFVCFCVLCVFCVCFVCACVRGVFVRCGYRGLLWVPAGLVEVTPKRNS